jgi:hypothetical protein
MAFSNFLKRKLNNAYRTPVCTFYGSRRMWYYPHPHFFIHLFNEIQAETLENVLMLLKTLSLKSLILSSLPLFEEKLFLPMLKQYSRFRHFCCITH